MIEIDKIAENLFDKIRSRFENINVGDEDAKATIDPEKARFFNFVYSDDGQDYGSVTLSIVDDHSLKVYFDKEMDKNMGRETRDAWYDFLKGLRKFARRNLLSFDIRDIAKSGLELKDLEHANKNADVIGKNDVNISESKMSKPFGTSRSTYQTLENVKIIARHSKNYRVDETKPGARSRHIEAIYIENHLGERFRCPDGSGLNGARAYARHIKNGGAMHDDFGQHITRMISEMASLKTFVRNMRGKQFEDTETNAMVEAAIDHYGCLHRDLFSIRGQRGYEQYQSLWQPEQPLLDDFDVEALKERFVRRVFDDRMMDALPIVQRAYEQRKSKIGEEFEAWADGVVSEMEDTDMFADRQSQKIGKAIIKAGEGVIADAPHTWPDDEDMLAFTIKDGKDMIRIGKTFIEQGMVAGEAAFWDVDTAVRDQMFDAVLDIGIDLNDVLLDETLAENDSPLTHTATEPMDEPSVMDDEQSDELFDKLFSRNDFQYTYSDSTYWFDSKEEVERAKDIIAAADATLDFPKMGVSNHSGKHYGSSTFDRQSTHQGVMESEPLDYMKLLAGITK
jgi:hypothetical protein